MLTITPIAIFKSPFETKFGIPRQSGLAPELRGEIHFLPAFRNPDALRGLESFRYIWLIWGFSGNRAVNSQREEIDRTTASPLVRTECISLGEQAGAGTGGAPKAGASSASEKTYRRHSDDASTSFSPKDPQWENSEAPEMNWHPTVRPPRLGGNRSMGVFATRSPFRPNSLGLSSVRVESVDLRSMIIHTLGADLMDKTPIYDIKPYLEYSDSHPNAGSGFADECRWTAPLKVILSETAKIQLGRDEHIARDDLEGLISSLSLDPRPRYRADSPQKKYGLFFMGHDVRFTVDSGTLTVIEAPLLSPGSRQT